MIKAYLHRKNTRQQRVTSPKSLLNWILPPVCAGCGRTGSNFCATCIANVTKVTQKLCMRCGAVAPNLGIVCSNCRTAHSALDKFYAATIFTGPIRPTIHAFKYQNRYGLAESLAGLMASAWPATEQYDMLIPVPLHPERKEKRGYNQAEELARHLQKSLSIPMVTDGLFRVRSTRQQVGLNKRQRNRNVMRAFEAVSQRVDGKHILLIDDVCTTGSTLLASAEALSRAGASIISAYCLAQTRNPDEHHYDDTDISIQGSKPSSIK